MEEEALGPIASRAYGEGYADNPNCTEVPPFMYSYNKSDVFEMNTQIKVATSEWSMVCVCVCVCARVCVCVCVYRYMYVHGGGPLHVLIQQV